MNANDSITRSFLSGDNIALNINLTTGAYRYYTRYVSSLNWYHNGTNISNTDRISITNNGTSLSISNMIDSDAGKYEVKIGSIDYYGYGSSSECDQNLLPALEVLALHAPVTFIVQQHHIPECNPEDTIKVFVLDPIHNILTINNSFAINTNRLLYDTPYRYFYKNGISQSFNTEHFSFTRSYGSEILLSHQIRYNNTEDVAGHYVYTEASYADYHLYSNCRSYYYYIDHNIFQFPVFIVFWTLLKNGEM